MLTAAAATALKEASVFRCTNEAIGESGESHDD